MQQQKPQKPLEGAQLVIMTIALSLATFMQVLDSTIANVAIPTIAGNLGSSLSQGTWVITSFGVANAISIPITGWLAKRVGEVKLFLWSTVAFVLASWACGMSSSLTMLIFFRVIQGIVAGPLIPLSQSLLLSNYPPAKRSVALALWSMTVIVAPICGPILGGYISDNYHWGWIFFINVPIGAVVVLMTLQSLRGRETRTEQRRIDSIGLALLILGIGSLQIMLDRGKELDWFNSHREMIENESLRDALSEPLKNLPDLERVASRIALGSVRPRELSGLRDALPALQRLSEAAALSRVPLISDTAAILKPDPALTDLLGRALLELPAVTLRDGRVIADSFSDELKELRELRDNAGNVLAQIEAREKERTGIPTLRVEYNRVSGYYIEVSRAQADKVPDDYRRRQTLKNTERFITPELKSLEDKALAAKDRALALERSLYQGLIESCSAYVDALTRASEAAATLDALLSFAKHAADMEWTCPELSDAPGLMIEGARHPVVEKALEHYVANDCSLEPGRRLLVITGPNMGGKSTYMRSVALIVILALAGSWVPAKHARIGSCTGDTR